MDRLIALKLSGFLTLLADGQVAVPNHVKVEAKQLLDALDDELARTIADEILDD